MRKGHKWGFPLWNSFSNCQLFVGLMTTFFHRGKYTACLPNQKRHKLTLTMFLKIAMECVLVAWSKRDEGAAQRVWLLWGGSLPVELLACFHGNSFAYLFSKYLHPGATGALSKPGSLQHRSIHIDIPIHSSQMSRLRTGPSRAEERTRRNLSS